MSSIPECAFEASAVAMVITDLHGRVLDANPAFHRLIAVDSDPRRMLDHIAALVRDKSVWTRTLDQIRTYGRWEGDLALMRADGQELPVSLWASLFGVGEEARSHIAFSLVQRSAQKHCDQAMQERGEKFSRLFESVPDAIVLIDAGTQAILDFNDAALRTYGYTAEEFSELSAMDLSAVPKLPDSALKRLTAPSSEKSILRWHRRKDGAIFPVEISDGVFEWKGRRIISGVVRDISHRRKVEEEKRHLDTAVEQAAEAIAITTPTGELTYVNPAFQKITGYHRSELIGKNMGILNSGKQAPEFFDRFWDTIEMGRTWHGRMTDRKKDGGYVELECTVSPIVDADGHIVNYVAVSRDVTHEMRLERQLRQAQKMEAIGTLAGGIAHDFNNLLQSILGHTDIILEDAHDGSRIHKSAEQVLIAGKRARDLVMQILMFSRQTEQDRRALLISPIAKEALKLLRSSIPSHIQIEHFIEQSERPVLADAIQIHQVIINLCSNAYQAMAESGGRLTLSLREVYLNEKDLELLPELPGPNDYVLLSVADTGPGMDERTLERIFEPYFTTKIAGAGTGLGLATVHGIVTVLGGAVRVVSRQGQGTTFDVYLPLCEPSEDLSLEDDEDVPLVHGDQRILFIDDESSIVEFAQVALSSFGYQVDGFDDSRTALEAFRGTPYAWDLVLTDQMMPGMTGTEIALEMRQIRPDIPIMLLSGYTDFASDEKVLAAGITSVIQKPFLAARIALEIQRILQ